MGSCKATFHLSLMICATLQIGRFIADRSVENINPDVTQYGMSLDISVSVYTSHNVNSNVVFIK